jgi:FkbM family methyltransferase
MWNQSVFVSYAQNFEDIMLWRALCDVKNGFYVDVGAADPDEETVTRAFYDRGWSGINIEPLDDYFDKLKRRRPRDVNLKVAAGRGTGVQTLHCFVGTGLSTLDPGISAQHVTEGRSAQHVSVPVLTLTEILLECAPAMIHFLKIDVEGAEAEVLEGLDLSRFRPWIIVVEATKPNSPEINTSGWEHLIVKHGYDLAYFDGLNCYYVTDEKPELKQRLKIPPNVFDCFVRWTEAVKAEKIAELEQSVLAEQTSKKKFQAKTNELQIGKAIAEAHLAKLNSALQSEQARVAELNAALESEHARFNDVISRLQDLQAQSAHPSPDKLIGRLFNRISRLAQGLKK